MLAHEFPTFDIALNKRGRAWRWCICTIEGRTLVRGSERSRRSSPVQRQPGAVFAPAHLSLWIETTKCVRELEPLASSKGRGGIALGPSSGLTVSDAELAPAPGQEFI